jgi:nucleoside-diphosphate-sugar epimerase
MQKASANSANGSAIVLVTGAMGFLGQHVVSMLCSRGINVVATTTSTITNGSGLTTMNVMDANSVIAAFRAHKPTHVINCAAYGVDQRLQDCQMAFAVNVRGVSNMMRGASDVGVVRFIQVGSCSEYKSSAEPISETAEQNPNDIYGISKSAGSLLALQYGRATGLAVSVVRPFGLWGPNEPPYRLSAQIVRAWHTRAPLKLTPCDVIRDYTYVKDMAEWLVSMTLDVELEPGSIVNLGSGRAVLLREFVNSQARVLNIVDQLQFGALPRRLNEQQSWIADVARLDALLPRRRTTSLAEGLQQTCAAFAGTAVKF